MACCLKPVDFCDADPAFRATAIGHVDIAIIVEEHWITQLVEPVHRRSHDRRPHWQVTALPARCRAKQVVHWPKAPVGPVIDRHHLAMKAAFRAVADARVSNMEPPILREDMAVPDLASWLAGITARYMRRQMVVVMNVRGELDWPFPMESCDRAGPPTSTNI